MCKTGVPMRSLLIITLSLLIYIYIIIDIIINDTRKYNIIITTIIPVFFNIFTYLSSEIDIFFSTGSGDLLSTVPKGFSATGSRIPNILWVMYSTYLCVGIFGT